MQDDSGLRGLLTRPWIYNSYQNLVGATWGADVGQRKVLAGAAGQKILDIGCSSGNVARHLPQGTKYVGFDVSEDYIGHARQAFAGRQLDRVDNRRHPFRPTLA